MSPGASLGGTLSDAPIRLAFLKWQCRIRQMAVREDHGRPGDGFVPSLTLPGEDAPMGHIITVLNKAPGHSVTPELTHIYRRTNDPAERREQAIRFLSATYYQKAREFSDIVTSTFAPGSPGAARIRAAERVTLDFAAFAQRFTLHARVWALASRNPLHQATMAHNRLFNPDLPSDSIVLGFEPDWATSSAEPGINREMGME